jgi:GMP synthase (glutamine-hydrolysing)
VQGDSRSYRQALAIDSLPNEELVRVKAPELTNRRPDINRVVAICGAKAPIRSLRAFEAYLTRERLNILRRADAIVRDFCRETHFEDRVWQFPVVLLPVGFQAACESVVLRPVGSIDGMTADAALMDPQLLSQLVERLLAIPEIGAVFYDLTNKPPGTIEWE